MSNSTGLLWGLAAVLFWTFPVTAQTPSNLVLEEPAAVLMQGLTMVAGVRELSNGHLLLVDPLEVTVLLVDSTLTNPTKVGRHGQGPGEYRLPTGVYPLSGDTSAVLDPGNGRLLLVLPSGEMGPVRNIGGGSSCPNTRFVAPGKVRGIDAEGRLYFQALPLVPSPDGTTAVGDSAAIERWRPGTCFSDTVASIPVDMGEGAVAAGGSILGGEAPLPYGAEIDWAVAEDGRIGIAYPDPFAVVIVEGDGSLHEGPEIGFRPVRLEEAHKQDWIERQEGPLLVSVLIRGQARATWQYRRMPARIPRRWPRHLPPFMPGAVRFSPDARLWIQVSRSPGEPPTFAVIDNSGSVSAMVQLPPGRRLVGLGRHNVYAVRTQEETGLEYLERYSLPSLLLGPDLPAGAAMARSRICGSPTW